MARDLLGVAFAPNMCHSLRMLRRLTLLAMSALLLPLAARAGVDATALEQRLSEATKSGKVTVVHFWAPWCPNCRNELKDGGWSGFIAANPKVNFVFVTIWNPVDGREVLAKYGVGSEANFQLLLHPNGSRKKGEMVSTVMGLPISWIPSTWIFRDGKLCYAMNYGELHFPVLKQLIVDSTGDW
jgi:thiol-disulfide isomerase/thioredoxin